MNKIFKYRIENGKTKIPKDAIILRIDHVDDGFYLGDFLWAIVNTEQRETVDYHWNGEKFGTNTHDAEDDRCCYYQLSVKEKQEIEIRGDMLIGAGEFDGKIFISYYPSSESKKFKIAVFKTGQEIDIPLKKLRYLGLNRLWIIQELGLYTFEILP